MSAARSHRARVVALTEGARVTPVELFLDLVFVYGFTQVTGFMADDLSWVGIARGMAILGLLWWLWTGFAWLGNLVRADEGPIRMALFAVMFVVFVMDITIPEAFVDGDDGGLWAPWVFAGGYLLVMVIHNVVMLYAARSVPNIRRNTLLLLIPAILTTALLFLAGRQRDSPAWQTLLWAGALLIMFAGLVFISAEGWHLSAASHFAERHGLIIIVALGETVVAIGVGVATVPISWEIVAAAALGITVLAALWWTYFDVVAIAAEGALQKLSDQERPRVARDAYTYLHFPMVAGIILLALGLEKVFEHLNDPMKPLALAALFGGASLYLLAHVAFRLRNVRTLGKPRLAVALLLPTLIPVTRGWPALGSLLLLAMVMVVLVSYETLSFTMLRDRIRRH